MELLRGMALNDYLNQMGGKIDVDFAIVIATEVGKALSPACRKYNSQRCCAG